MLAQRTIEFSIGKSWKAASSHPLKSEKRCQSSRQLLQARFCSSTRYIKGSSTKREWPAIYRGLYSPETEEWPETTPLKVRNRDGKLETLSHVRGAETKPLLSQTMFSSLEKTVSKYGDNKALSVPFQRVSWSYKELKQAVDELALGLLGLGVQKGDRIGCWLPNTSEWITLQYAVARIGAVLVCVNPAYRANELKHAINLTGLKGLFYQASIKTSNYVELLKQAAPSIVLQRANDIQCHEIPSLRFLVHISDTSELIPHEFPSILYQTMLGSVDKGLEAALDAMSSGIDENEPTNIQFTSGTTGMPKGTTLTHRNIVNNGYFVGERIDMTEQDTLVTPVPMYHCFGCVMSNIASVTHGSHLVYPAPSFNAEATLKAVADFKATHLHGVPTMFISERSLPNFSSFDLSSLRSGIMAGSSCPEVTMNMVRTDMHLKDITICYGMTETSPVSIQTTRHDPVWARIETVGTIHDHLQVKIVDPETGMTVKVGQSGEILTHGYSVMKSYWGNEKATMTSIVDGWMHTGDLGTMDDMGYVRVVGRNKDMISRGGEKIYPREIEEFLYKHPSILDVQIVGVPDDRLGEEVFAWIKLKPGCPALSIDDIASFCKDKISHYKVPRHVHCLEPGEDFPMTISGKIQKYVLRDRAVNLLQSL